MASAATMGAQYALRRAAGKLADAIELLTAEGRHEEAQLVARLHDLTRVAADAVGSSKADAVGKALKRGDDDPEVRARTLRILRDVLPAGMGGGQ